MAEKDPEELIGYEDGEGCLIPIKNWAPGYALHGQPVPEHYKEVRNKDLDDPRWEVTI